MHATPTGIAPKMPRYSPTPSLTNRPQATMYGLRLPNPPAATPTPTPQVPNTPSGVSLAQGPGSALTVTWTAPAIDSTHSAATGFNLRSSPTGAATWTTVSGVTSPHNFSGLAAGS